VGDTTFYWDFYGPRAEGTARHFVKHLDEFLHRERVDGCASGVEQLGAAHWAAWCRTPPGAVEAIRRALKPRRWRDEGDAAAAPPDRQEERR
jgi:hypothetical protein